MLYGHPPHTLKPGDHVLVWGASGGLGVFGVQLVAASGANAIGIVSDESKRDYVMQLGAKGVINRKDFACWGQMPKVGSSGGGSSARRRQRSPASRSSHPSPHGPARPP